MNPSAIKDRCRKNLIRYTLRAFSLVHLPEDPLILDIGCGSGVPTLALMGVCPGRFIAVDPDPVCLRRLRQKIHALGVSARIELVQASIFALPPFPEKFDVIVAEGSLHIAGFTAGLAIVSGLLKNGGHALVHEPLAGDGKRRALFRRQRLEVIDASVLGEETWRKEYFECLERAIREAGDDAVPAEVASEIEAFRRDPASCLSIYYVLRKISGAWQ